MKATIAGLPGSAHKLLQAPRPSLASALRQLLPLRQASRGVPAACCLPFLLHLLTYDSCSWVNPAVCRRHGILGSAAAAKKDKRCLPLHQRPKGLSDVQAAAYSKFYCNPNAYFYRLLEPGQKLVRLSWLRCRYVNAGWPNAIHAWQAKGNWTAEEHALFMQTARRALLLALALACQLMVLRHACAGSKAWGASGACLQPSSPAGWATHAGTTTTMWSWRRASCDKAARHLPSLRSSCRVRVSRAAALVPVHCTLISTRPLVEYLRAAQTRPVLEVSFRQQLHAPLGCSLPAEHGEVGSMVSPPGNVRWTAARLTLPLYAPAGATQSQGHALRLASLNQLLTSS